MDTMGFRKADNFPAFKFDLFTWKLRRRKRESGGKWGGRREDENDLASLASGSNPGTISATASI